MTKLIVYTVVVEAEDEDFTGDVRGLDTQRVYYESNRIVTSSAAQFKFDEDNKEYREIW